MVRYFYRIVRSRWAGQSLNGEGARLYGGRWNQPGVPAVYLAESRALAALEILVHAPREALLLDWRVIEVAIPSAWIEEIPNSKLPLNWRDQPTSVAARNLGTGWLREGDKPALLLPSVIVPEENSLLLNPRHPLMEKIKAGEPKVFSFDPRLAG